MSLRHSILRRWVMLFVLTLLAGPSSGFVMIAHADPLDEEAAAETVPKDEEVVRERQENALRKAVTTLNSTIPEDINSQILTAQLGGSDPTRVIIAGVLADRRYSRLYAILVLLPRDRAATESLAIYESQLEQHLHAWKQVEYVYRDAQGQVLSNRLHDRAQSLAIALVLCAQFCSPADALPLVKRWETTMQQSFAETKFPNERYQGLARHFMSDVLPDPLFELNYYNILAGRIPQPRTASADDQPRLGFPEDNPTPAHEINPRMRRNVFQNQVRVIRDWRVISDVDYGRQHLDKTYTILEQRLGIRKTTNEQK
jgi:hypothetical protein